jgi:hypothetical protein
MSVIDDAWERARAGDPSAAATILREALRDAEQAGDTQRFTAIEAAAEAMKEGLSREAQLPLEQARLEAVNAWRRLARDARTVTSPPPTATQAKTRRRLFLENACLLGGAILIWLSILGAVVTAILVLVALDEADSIFDDTGPPTMTDGQGRECLTEDATFNEEFELICP